MPNIKLRNGITLSNAQVTATIAGAAGALSFEPDPTMPNGKGIAILSSSGIVDRHMNPITAAYQASGRFNVAGIDPLRADVRFMHLAFVNFYNVTYAGAHSPDGMVDYSYVGNLTGRWLLDCLTNNAATDGINRPYYHGDTTPTNGPTFFPMMSDTPRANVALNLYNGKTGKENYLWNFETSTLFLTYAVFKHADFSIEPIQGVSWQLDRELELRWKDGLPVRKTFRSSVAVKDANVALDPGHHLHKKLVDSSGLEIVNVATNAALGQMRGKPGSIRFDELNGYWDGFVEDFWT